MVTARFTISSTPQNSHPSKPETVYQPRVRLGVTVKNKNKNLSGNCAQVKIVWVGVDRQ